MNHIKIQNEIIKQFFLELKYSIVYPRQAQRTELQNSTPHFHIQSEGKYWHIFSLSEHRT